MARDNPNHRNFVDSFTDRDRPAPRNRTNRPRGRNNTPKPEEPSRNLPAERRTTQPTSRDSGSSSRNSSSNTPAERRTTQPTSRGSNVPAERGNTSVRNSQTIRSTPPAEGMRTVGSSSTVGRNRLPAPGPRAATSPASVGRLGQLARRAGPAGAVIGGAAAMFDYVNNPDKSVTDAIKRYGPGGTAYRDTPESSDKPRTPVRTSNRDRGTLVGAGRTPRASDKPADKPAKASARKPAAKPTSRSTPTSESTLNKNASLGGAIEFYMRRDGLTRQQAAAKAKAEGYK